MIIKETLYYDPAGEDRTVHIYLPDNYNETDERYPVMYFFDGHNLFLDSDATYGKSWGLKEFLDGWQKPMMVVGLECSHQGNHRLDEYCPYDANLMNNNIHGEGRETMDWIVGTLKPYIDKNYRTYSFREATAPRQHVSPPHSSSCATASSTRSSTAGSTPTRGSTSHGVKRKAVKTPTSPVFSPRSTTTRRTF